MNKVGYIIAIVLVLMVFSCKSKRNLIKENDTKVATTQVITVNDTTKWIKEILDIINKQLTYRDKSITTTTNATNDTITTTQNDIELVITIDIQKDETIKEQKDVHSIDSTTTVSIVKNKEELTETKDTRPIQGKDWVYVIITCVIVLGLIVGYIVYIR